jgi:hypothetical protein
MEFLMQAPVVFASPSGGEEERLPNSTYANRPATEWRTSLRVKWGVAIRPFSARNRERNESE